MNKKATIRARKRRRIRARLSGTAARPRITVFRSLRATYVQAIDDTSGKIILQQSDLKARSKDKPVDRAKELGKSIGSALIEKKIQYVVFDRAGYRYHGRVKAVAEGAREAGLTF